MSSGNGPIVRIDPAVSELESLGLPVDPVKERLVEPAKKAVRDLDADFGMAAEIQRREPRHSPNIRPLIIQDLEQSLGAKREGANISGAHRDSRTTKPNSGKPSPSSAKKNLLSNPYYRYEGDPLSRVMTFLANVIKMIEQLFLNRLQKSKMPLPAPKIVLPKLQDTSNSINPKKKKDGKLPRIEDAHSVDEEEEKAAGPVPIIVPDVVPPE